MDAGPRTERKHERVRVAGSVRMMVDTSDGLRFANGQLVDICESGCKVLLHTCVDQGVAARVQVDVAGKQIWLPVATRWTRSDPRGWTIGCSFDRPTDEKQRAIRSLVWARRKLVKSSVMPGRR